MGISERKERQKLELREQILAAARKLFLEYGIEKTSMRNIADMIEYSPGTIYQYFKDKNAIFHALHSEGFSELSKRMEVLFAVSDPMERLKAMGKVYIKFAIENVEMYDLMFIKEAPIDYVLDKAHPHWHEGERTFDVLRKTVMECMEKGHFRDQHPEAFAFMVWSLVHGTVSLYIRRRTEVLDCTGIQIPADHSEGPQNEAHQYLVSAAYDCFLKVLDKL